MINVEDKIKLVYYKPVQKEEVGNDNNLGWDSHWVADVRALLL